MHSVTSNAVAESFGEWENVFGTGNIKGLETKNGKYLTFHFQGYSASYGQVLGTVVQRWIPSSNLYIPFINGCFLVLDTNGNIGSYNLSGGSFQLYGDAVILFN